MNKITDIKELSAYMAYFKADWDKRDINKLPVNIREQIEKREWIMPEHLTKSLFKNLLVESLKNSLRGEKFLFDENNNPLIDQIAAYYTKDESFSQGNRNFKKGILIMGPVGCGKTALFLGLNRLLQTFFTHNGSYDTHAGFTVIPSYLFREAYGIDGDKIFQGGLLLQGNMMRFLNSPLLIDDIGCESLSVHFGSSVNVVGEVILRRYDTRAITFATTNLDQGQLKTFYGERCFSRMKEMMNFLILRGNDRRK